MQRTGVITGDIVGSSRIQDKQALNEALHEVLEVAGQRFQAQGQIYRGDELQLLLPQASDAVLAAVLLRASIISRSPSRQQGWDLRVAIGIADPDDTREPVGESNGEAFVLSGRGLDGLGKSGERLCILTPSERLNRLLSLPTRLVDDIISHWSHYSAQIAYYSLLYNEPQTRLAQRLGRSQPTINTRLSTAKLSLVRAYINYTRETLTTEWQA